MKTVGLRELKNRLAEYIRQVRHGESVLVTDRGQVVAEIWPAGARDSGAPQPPGLWDLARRGLATVGKPNGAHEYPDLPAALAPGRPAGLLAAERGDR